MKKALFNCRVFDGEKLHGGLAVLLEKDRISALLPESISRQRLRSTFDLAGHILAPGLIDIQVNGGGGVMFNDAPTVKTHAYNRCSASPLWHDRFSADTDQYGFATMKRAIEAVRRAVTEAVPGVLGIHLEGPFLNPGQTRHPQGGQVSSTR